MCSIAGSAAPQIQYAGCMSSSTQEQVGIRLRDARKAAGLTQQQVAEEFNITRQAISGWECGKHEPTLTQFRQLGLLYVASADWMLYGMRMVPASTKAVMKQVFGPSAETAAG